MSSLQEKICSQASISTHKCKPVTVTKATTRQQYHINEEFGSTSIAVWPLVPIPVFLPIFAKAFVNQIRISNHKEPIFQPDAFSSPVTNWYSELAPLRVK